ncbi:uncharacterized protein [Centruroides vittatus]|uniref:uncharacterized protein n=1 Tax=Centruroides vittatus TaxID=120091 RepID=UPI0035101256
MLVASWGLSIMTSMIYDDFISIGRFSSTNLRFEFKFKIIGFMKRFRGMPMGISVAGFFFVKKNFLIRVASALYSIFSSVIEVTGVMNKNRYCTKLISTNTTILSRH